MPAAILGSSFASLLVWSGLLVGPPPMLDVASASTTAGLGLLTWSLTYRRDAKAYQRARVIGLRPTLGRDRFGLGVGGRF